MISISVSWMAVPSKVRLSAQNRLRPSINSCAGKWLRSRPSLPLKFFLRESFLERTLPRPRLALQSLFLTENSDRRIASIKWKQGRGGGRSAGNFLLCNDAKSGVKCSLVPSPPCQHGRRGGQRQVFARWTHPFSKSPYKSMDATRSLRVIRGLSTFTDWLTRGWPTTKSFTAQKRRFQTNRPKKRGGGEEP